MATPSPPKGLLGSGHLRVERGRCLPWSTALLPGGSAVIATFSGSSLLINNETILPGLCLSHGLIVRSPHETLLCKNKLVTAVVTWESRLLPHVRNSQLLLIQLTEDE